MKILVTIATLLVVVGALNWGLVGLFEFDLVSFLLGSVPLLMRAVYVLVAASGIVVLINQFSSNKA